MTEDIADALEAADYDDVAITTVDSFSTSLDSANHSPICLHIIV